MTGEIERLNFFQDLGAVDVRKSEVREDYIKCSVFQHLNGFFARIGSLHIEAFLCEDCLDNLPLMPVIFYNKNTALIMPHCLESSTAWLFLFQPYSLPQ